MIKPDLICAWPDTIDFPLFRKFLMDERFRFAKVIIVFTETNWGKILIDEIKQKLDGYNITFLQIGAAYNGEDWRNNAMHKALKASDAEWIWFTEQDFFILKPKEFWQGIADCVETGADAVGYYQNNERLHPCCLFIKRFVLDNYTQKNFAVVPGVGDHFIQIEKDLDETPDEVSVFKISEEARMDWFKHMNGLTHNLYLVKKGEKPVYQPREFYKYLARVKREMFN